MDEPNATSLVNPSHPVQPEIADALAAFRYRNRAAVERDQEIAQLARPTAEEREAMAELAGATGAKPGMRDLGKRYAERIENADLPPAFEHPELSPVADSSDAPVDHSFWWSRTDPFVPSFYKSDFRADGLHFTGKKTYDANPLFPFNFGATSTFGIDPARLPHSPSGRWRSAPSAELFGGLLGWTGPYDIFGGDSWCKVWIVRRQTILQFGFGPTGPVPIVKGQGVDSFYLLREENMHRAYRHQFNGFQGVPAVDFGGILPQTVWSQVEVRFDVQLEGNSFLWLDPDVLLRVFQWPVFAL